MKSNSQIATTKEQSEKLLSLGLKRETADMCYRKLVNSEHHTYDSLQCATPRSIDIPAWSLHRLLFLIPKEINIDGFRFPLRSDAIMRLEDADYMYDRIIEIIERVIKQGYFNKDYLVGD